jgi:hypothetical protein
LNINGNYEIPPSSPYNVPAHRAVVVHYWTKDSEANHFYQQFSIDRKVSVTEFILMSHEYFQTVAVLDPNTRLYELRFASKSGQPKEDLPGEV